MDDPVTLTVNGAAAQVTPQVGERLSHTLRERLGARDVKVGCNAGDCGACTVLVDGAPVCACLMPTQQAAGARVETLAGLRDSAEGRALSARFQDHQAAQCGICTPGMIVSAIALLRANAALDEAAVQDALAGVLCRCTGYRKIVDAVMGRAAPLSGKGAVGDSIRRVDGAARVAGTARFGDDVAPSDALIVRLIRSPHPRAAFTLGNVAAWQAATPGVIATLDASDVPGLNAYGVIPAFVDQPVFAIGETRHRGEPVAAVICTPDPPVDLSDFPVTFTPLPAVQSMAEAMASDAPQLHEGRPGNVMTGGFVQCGDVDAALARADHVVEGHFTSGFVEHAYIEPEAGFACMNGERIEIHACTQAPVMDRDSVALILGWPRERVRILPTEVGGGFGSKLDLSVQPYLALAALKTGQPVRMAYSRCESMQATTKRHPSDLCVRIGATNDGKLCGMRFDGLFNTGAYASWGPTVANRVPVHASGPYRIADYRAEARGIHTHNPPSGAFRGFGVPQSAIAQEVLFDDLAEKLGLDPLEFRAINTLRNGEPTICGQVFDQGVGIGACFDALRPAWAAARAECVAFNAAQTRVKRGVGIAGGWYGCGNTSLPNPSTIKAGIRADGTVVLHQGAMDIGQGANTVIAQIFAQALGVPLARVSLIGPDTDLTPDAGKTSASRQTFVTGAAARLCGAALRGAILKRLNAPEDVSLTVQDGQIGAEARSLLLSDLDPDAEGYVFRAQETYDPPTRPLDENGQGAPYAQFGYAAHMAVVEVDMTLGTVTPIRFAAAHDVGQAINPLLVEGQVQGGIAQGLGMALMEEYLPGRTENLHDYLIPTIGDIPPIDTLIVEVPDAHGPYGAKGLGEHVLIPTAPAILNAIRHATGVRLRAVPVTPSRLFAALKAMP